LGQSIQEGAAIIGSADTHALALKRFSEPLGSGLWVIRHVKQVTDERAQRNRPSIDRNRHIGGR